jgi:hypothetical protein
MLATDGCTPAKRFAPGFLPSAAWQPADVVQRNGASISDCFKAARSKFVQQADAHQPARRHAQLPQKAALFSKSSRQACK